MTADCPQRRLRRTPRREIVVHRHRRRRRADRSPAPEHRHRRDLGAADHRLRAGRLSRHRLRPQRLGQEHARSRIRPAAGQHCRRSSRSRRLSPARKISPARRRRRRLRRAGLCGVASGATVQPHRRRQHRRHRGSTKSAISSPASPFPISGSSRRITGKSAPSYRGANPEGTRRWIEIDEHSRQPGVAFQPPLRTPNTLAKIATIPTPTLIIAADADLLAPPALMRYLGGAPAKSRMGRDPRRRPRHGLGAAGRVQRHGPRFRQAALKDRESWPSRPFIYSDPERELFSILAINPPWRERSATWLLPISP